MYQHQPYGPDSFKLEIAKKFATLRQKYNLSSQVGATSKKITPAQFSLGFNQPSPLKRSA